MKVIVAFILFAFLTGCSSPENSIQICIKNRLEKQGDELIDITVHDYIDSGQGFLVSDVSYKYYDSSFEAIRSNKIGSYKCWTDNEALDNFIETEKNKQAEAEKNRQAEAERRSAIEKELSKKRKAEAIIARKREEARKQEITREKQQERSRGLCEVSARSIRSINWKNRGLYLYNNAISMIENESNGTFTITSEDRLHEQYDGKNINWASPDFMHEVSKISCSSEGKVKSYTIVKSFTENYEKSNRLKNLDAYSSNEEIKSYFENLLLSKL